MVINMVFGQEEYELGMLGRQGENIETVLRIDCTSVLEECPGATIGVRWKDNVPGEEYYDLAVTKAEDGIYEAKLTTMDLRYAGNKDIVVRVIEGEWEKRSCTFMGYVAKSLFDFRPPAGPVSDYLSRLMKALAKAEEIQKHGPVIGENGRWYIFDGGAYVDTGVKAEGRDGEDGYSPTLTAERVENGVKLTVTNKESTKEVWVYDGEKGDNATDEQIRAAVDAYMQDNPVTGGGLTSAQITALDGMFKVAAYSKADVPIEYAAFKAAFGIEDVEEPEEPDTPVVTTYSIINELVNVTSDNSANSVNENAAYTAHLTANEGYTLEGGSVTVLMGGVDITATAYADGVITIAAVTGNVEIIASAVEEQTASGELVTDGLVFDFDFRNVTMEAYNLSGWGNVYRTVDKTNTALLFGNAEGTGDNVGLQGYSFRENRQVASETEKVRLGTAYTAQALYRKKTAGAKGFVGGQMFNWGWSGNLGLSTGTLTPKYLAETTETAVSGAQMVTISDTADYAVITYVADGASLKIYYNAELIYTYDGATYDGFTQWQDYGTPNSQYNQSYAVAFVGYNRALTEAEIIDNLAYFKTLEVTA